MNTTGVASAGLAVTLTPAAAAEPPPAEPFGYCLNTSTIQWKLPLAEEIELAARAGYQGIEPWVRELDQHVKDGKSLKDLGKLARDRGVSIEELHTEIVSGAMSAEHGHHLVRLVLNGERGGPYGIACTLNGIAGTSDQLTVYYWFWQDRPDNMVEQIRFADGSVWDPAMIKQMVLTGGAGMDSLVGYASDDVLQGLAGKDTLWGRSGNDRLDGGTGADAMYGETGDDTYVVDDAGDLVVEALNAGVDTIEAAVTYSLPANVENLTLTGQSASNATGNELGNVLIGNSSANVMDGGIGNDTLKGGLGNDTYRLNPGWGHDVISENDSTPSNVDTVLFGGAVHPLDLDAQTFVPGLQLRRVLGAEIFRLEDWTDLEHGHFARHRNGAATRPGNGLFHRLHFPDPETRNEFLGLGKWAIDGQCFVIAHAHRRRP
jgi:hypothetical protein